MSSCLLNLCALRCVQIILWRKDLLQTVGPGTGLPLRLCHDEARSVRLKIGVNDVRPRNACCAICCRLSRPSGKATRVGTSESYYARASRVTNQEIARRCVGSSHDNSDLQISNGDKSRTVGCTVGLATPLGVTEVDFKPGQTPDPSPLGPDVCEVPRGP
jgi:hypothetical protein